MGIISRIFKIAAVGGATTAGAFAFWTRNSHFMPFPTNDPSLRSSALRKYNPNGNPSVKDVCIRKVPLIKIKPDLLEKDGKLVEAFSAGIWGGPGYAMQRAILARTNQGPSTAHQLWSPEELQTSTYEVGTQMTDHFEVLEHTPESILIRCGDSPLRIGVREADGLFEVSTRVNRDEGVVEYRLKSIFFQGLGKTDKLPLSGLVVWAHKQYTKLWMETGIRNTMRL